MAGHDYWNEGPTQYGPPPGWGAAMPAQEELFDQGPIPIAQLITCVEREMRYRHAVYPRRVDKGTMTQGKADREIKLMAAVLDKLKELANG